MRYLLAMIMMLAAAPALADSEAREGADWVRISADPCKDEKVLAHIAAAGEDAKDYRRARAEIQGASYSGCWQPLFNKEVIYLRYEDGDSGVVPFRDLKPVKSV